MPHLLRCTMWCSISGYSFLVPYPATVACGHGTHASVAELSQRVSLGNKEEKRRGSPRIDCVTQLRSLFPQAFYGGRERGFDEVRDLNFWQFQGIKNILRAGNTSRTTTAKSSATVVPPERAWPRKHRHRSRKHGHHDKKETHAHLPLLLISHHGGAWLHLPHCGSHHEAFAYPPRRRSQKPYPRCIGVR